MKELNITEGEWKGIETKNLLTNTSYTNIFCGKSNDIYIGLIAATHLEHGNSNSLFVIDAANTAQKTGKLYSEREKEFQKVKAQRDAFLSLANKILSLEDLIKYPKDTKPEHYNEAISTTDMLNELNQTIQKIKQDE
jgi:hypothetical protein